MCYEQPKAGNLVRLGLVEFFDLREQTLGSIHVKYG